MVLASIALAVIACVSLALVENGAVYDEASMDAAHRRDETDAPCIICVHPLLCVFSCTDPFSTEILRYSSPLPLESITLRPGYSKYRPGGRDHLA